MKKIIFFILIFLLIFSNICIAHKILFSNNTNIKKIYYLNWINHPYGCYFFYGNLECDYSIAVGEVEPHKTIIVDQKTDDNIYCIEWNNINSSNKKEKFEKNCYKNSENIEKIISMPGFLTIIRKK
jgi:hypothetical protein